MSSNQPVLPHAVIALNASELNIDQEQWDTKISTSWLMKSVQSSLTSNVLFKKHTQIWKNRGRQINTVKDLLLSYYSTVTVVRIPANGRPKLMKDQVQKLYSQIIKSTEAARKSKRDLRMLLDGGELQTYLQFAFDHFSSNLDQAFDFVQASFIYNPIPSDFAGNILKLAVGMMERWEHELDGKAIFTELSHMVASCIMLDSARNKTRGSAELIFPEYVDSCDNALEDFCDRYWPCEYVMKAKTKRGKEVGGRCVNVRSGHGSKGHQFKNGKVIAVGNYESSFSAESFQEVFRFLVFTFLKELLGELRKTKFTSQPEDKVAAQIHKTQVMRPFYTHVNRGMPPILGSHSACFCCLMASPEHALPCGHVLCTACLIAYGQREERDAIEITSCPLHSGRTFRWMVFLKPEAAGVRVLTLDGGGIRGIVELEILRLIENVWGGGLRIQDFFDLIVGTSTGGLIALGLAAKDWTVENCIYHFTDLCEKAFTRRVGMNIPGMSMLVESLHHSKYETAPLQQALQQAFSPDDYLFGGPRETNHRTKVAVTATNSGSVSVLANYNRNCAQKVPYTFQRPEKLTSELKIWEAARATSAAPRIFKPFSHEPSKQVYVDGAVYHNNPIHIADLERRLLWPSDGHSVPDFVLSIGTAYNPNSRKKLIEKSSMVNVGIFGHAKSLASIAMDHIRSSLDSEKTYQDFILQIGLPKEYSDRYQRINPLILEDPPALDDVHRMKDLQSTVRKQMTNDTAIISAAYRLLATSFYFEKISPIIPQANGSLLCTGMIRCRLPRATFADLGRFLGTSHERSEGPYFVIRERNRPQDAQQIFITPETLTNLIFKRKWHMNSIHITVSNPIALTEIVLCIKKNEEFPISGFPRTLQEEDLRSSKLVSTVYANTANHIV
jgi:predicted acylesterase/phospholipase RssA